MLVRCWPIVFAAGPTLYQHWLNVSCLLWYLATVFRRLTCHFWAICWRLLSEAWAIWFRLMFRLMFRQLDWLVGCAIKEYKQIKRCSMRRQCWHESRLWVRSAEDYRRNRIFRLLLCRILRKKWEHIMIQNVYTTPLYGVRKPGVDLRQII